MGRRGSGGWDGFAAGGEGLHEFYAGAVGVEEVDLTLAVDAGVGVERLGVCLVGEAGFEGGDGGGEVGDDEGDVLAAATLVGWAEVAVEHELYIVLAVGDAHVDPTELFAVGAAAPELAEAEDVAVEVDRFFAVADQESEMVDAVGDAGGGEKFTGVAPLHAVGLGLYEFNQGAVGVFDLEVAVAGFAFAYGVAGGDAMGVEVEAHLLGVGDEEGDVAEVSGACGRLLVEEFDVLVVVDFDEGDADGAVGILEVVGLVVAEEAVPEVEGFGEVGDEVASVGDAEDFGTLYGLSEERAGEKESQEGDGSGFVLAHCVGSFPFVAA